MTIEQKAKAYDEALERARSLQHDNGWVTTIFPELKESEDEKIRGKIVSILEQYALICAKEGDPCLELNDCLAYLEKQKVPADGDFARGYDCGYECCLHSHGAEWFERQKKQKPAKWNDADDKIHRNLMSLLSCMRGDRIAEETYKKYYPWLRDLPKRFNLQQEQPEVDLEKEINSFFPESYFETAINFDDVADIARHFYELGLKARK